MPTTVFTATNALQLLGVTDSGGTLSWTGYNSVTATGAAADVVDQNDDNDLDIGNDTFGSGGLALDYTGYTVEIGGNTFGVFSGDPFGGGTIYSIPYNTGIQDINGVLPTNSSTSTNTDNAVIANCFATGTMIDTPDGPRAIETLKAGDSVTTSDGAVVAVKWLGRQTLPIVTNVPWLTEKLTPVLITASALGEYPSQDLVVSADHGILVDGYLVNAGVLVNDKAIRVLAASELPKGFTYWHVETEEHDVIVANGTQAETFIDAAGRAAFDNHHEYLDMYGVDRVIPEMRIDRITTPRLLPDAIKARLGITDVTAAKIA
ncbi:MAG: Hint domain-containing protein [Pseudomonadota bacterium]